MTVNTYYECLTDEGKPATPRQQKAYGTRAYGYKTRIAAELACPNGCAVGERHSEHGQDWAGRLVSYRTTEGQLIRHH